MIVFVIIGKMLLLSGLNVETNGKSEILDTFFSVSKTSIPASVALLGYFWFLKTVSNLRNLAVLILAFSTMIFIFWGKSKGYVF